jgi:Tfp pilus assembly protein PilO
MSNTIKIILIVVFFIISALLVVLLIIPNLSTSVNASAALQQEEEYNRSYVTRLGELESVRDEYNTLDASYQKYSMQIPSENDLDVFTNEIYEIAAYSGVAVKSIDYMEIVSEEDEEKPEKVIEASFILEGSYYNIINFIRTIEKMPRIVIIENVVMQSTQEEYETLSAYVNTKMYYIDD